LTCAPAGICTSASAWPTPPCIRSCTASPAPGASPPGAGTQPQPTSSPSTYHRIAEASRLRVSEDHAAHLVHAAGCGTTLTLIAMPEDRRDSALSHTAREAVIAAITTDAPAPIEPGPIAAAVALRAVRKPPKRIVAAARGEIAPPFDD